MASGPGSIGGSPPPDRRLPPDVKVSRGNATERVNRVAGRMMTASAHRLAPHLLRERTVTQLSASKARPTASTSISSIQPGTSSGIIPPHVKFEPLLPSKGINTQVAIAMDTWHKVLHPERGAPGKPVLYIRIDAKNRLEVCCCAEEVIVGEKRELMKSGQGHLGDIYYIYDPKEVAKKLSEHDLTWESCEKLSPFVQSVEQLFVKGVRGVFGRFRGRVSEVVNKSVPTLDVLTHLRPESKPVKHVIGVRGGLYQGITLTGPEGASEGDPCCNDWVGIKTNGTIGVIDGPSHGRPELPARYFSIYQEIFDTFDRAGEGLQNYYANTPGLSDRQFEIDAKPYLSEKLLPLRIQINRMADEEITQIGTAREDHLASMRALNERLCTPEAEMTVEEVALLFGEINEAKLAEAIEGVAALFERFQVNPDDPDLNNVTGILTRREESTLLLKFYTAIQTKDYPQILEFRGALWRGIEGIQPLISDSTKALLKARTGSARFPETDEERLLKNLSRAFSETFESMLSSSDRGIGPAMAFAKLIRTEKGLFLLRLQAADATCLTLVPGQLPKIDAELRDSTGFGGNLDGNDTEIRLQRIEPGTIVSVQSDGVTDFIDLKGLTSGVSRARDPDSLYENLVAPMYAPAGVEPRFCAIKNPRGNHIPMKSIDVTGRDSARVDDFSCVRMEIVSSMPQASSSGTR